MEVSERTVVVWDNRYTITVHHKSRAVWVAVGDWLGEPLWVQARTRRIAVTRWVRAAMGIRTPGESRPALFVRNEHVNLFAAELIGTSMEIKRPYLKQLLAEFKAKQAPEPKPEPKPEKTSGEKPPKPKTTSETRRKAKKRA